MVRVREPFRDGEMPKAKCNERPLSAREAVNRKAVTPPRWTLHNLRRTLVTEMNELGIEPHVVEAMVNHVAGT